MLVKRIVEEQTMIMGPLALELAKRTEGLVYESDSDININGDPKTVLTGLVEQYRTIFGEVSVQVSKQALSTVVQEFQAGELPEVLV